MVKIKFIVFIEKKTYSKWIKYIYIEKEDEVNF